MKTIIVTDSTCDLPEKFYEDDFYIAHLSYQLDDDIYDGVENKIPHKEFYDRMRAGALSKTSMVTRYEFEQIFDKILSEGNDLLYIAFSSGLSGTHDNAFAVAKEMQAKYPERKIKVIDTKLASIGEGLLVYYVLQRRKEGADFDALAEYAQYLSEHICSYFTVDDLKHLARMGRVTKTSAFIGTLAKIKPVMYVNIYGKLIPISKVVSRKKALSALVDKMEEKMFSADKQKKIFIGHGDCYDDAKYVADLITKRFGITDIDIDYVGEVIGSHTNAGVVALFFLGEDKREIKDGSLQA